MWELIQAGKTEQEALDEVFPIKDSAGKLINRKRYNQLEAWKDNDLWPSTIRREFLSFPLDEAIQREQEEVKEFQRIRDVRPQQESPPSSVDAVHQPAPLEEEEPLSIPQTDTVEVHGMIINRKVLQEFVRVLNGIEVHEREWTGGRHKKTATVRSKILAGRLPEPIVEEVQKLKGSLTDNLERAVKLYLLVLEGKRMLG